MAADSLGFSKDAAEAVFGRLFLTAEGHADPYPLYHQLRQTAPVPGIKRGTADSNV